MKIIITENQHRKFLLESRVTQAWYLFDILQTQLGYDGGLCKNKLEVAKDLRKYKRIDSNAYLSETSISDTIWNSGKIPANIMDMFSDCQEIDDEFQNSKCKERVRYLFNEHIDDVLESEYPLAYYLYDDFDMTHAKAFSTLARVSDMFSGADDIRSKAVDLYKFAGEQYLGDEREYLAKVYNSNSMEKVVYYIQNKMNISFALWEFLKELNSLSSKMDMIKRMKEVEVKYNLPKTFIARLAWLYN